jgi:hypothetical protein
MAENDIYPYKAINVFLERDDLEQLLEMIIKEKDSLTKQDQIEFNNEFRKHVTILGFRNPVRAPISLQVNAYASAFEQKDEVIPFTLSTWTKIQPNLAEKVKIWLEAEGWDELKLERQFEEGEGFIKKWPDDYSFDKLVDEFTKANPDPEFSRNDLILMVLWISGRLPNQESEL